MGVPCNAEYWPFKGTLAVLSRFSRFGVLAVFGLLEIFPLLRAARPFDGAPFALKIFENAQGKILKISAQKTPHSCSVVGSWSGHGEKDMDTMLAG